MIKLEHPFAFHNDLSFLLNDTQSLPQYLKKLRNEAKLKRLPSREDGELDPAQLKFIGDGFELFGEVFLKLLGRGDNRIWIKDFKRITENDNGVDGEGVDTRTGNRVFIQFKCYREYEYLTGVGSHLDSFVTETTMMLEDEIKKSKDPKKQYIIPRRIVITSAAGIHRYTAEEKYRGGLECYDYKKLARLVDTNDFWDEFRKGVADAKEKAVKMSQN